MKYNRALIASVAVLVGAAMLSLPAVSQANTVSDLTLEDITGGAGTEVDMVTGLSIVEFEVYDKDGTPGNTVNSETGLHWTTNIQDVDGMFWRRTNMNNGVNWEDLGGEDIQFRAHSDTNFPGEGDPPDIDGIAQVTMTLSNLDASRIYDVYVIALGWTGATVRTYAADFGSDIATTEYTDVEFGLLHVKGNGDNPYVGPFDDGPEPHQQDWGMGLYAALVGTSGGVETMDVSLTVPEGADRTYWLGFGYVDVGAATIYGDADGSGVVDAADYIALKAHIGQSTGATTADGDFDGDGDVDFDDLQILQDTFGATVSATTTVVPEPCSAMLLVFGAAALLRRRLRR